MSEVKPLWTALGKFDVRKEELSSNNSQLPLLSVTQNSGVVRYADLFPDRCQRAEDLNRYKVVSIGDIVLNTMSAGTGAVGVAKEPGVVSPDYSTFRPRIGFDSTFLYYCLKSRDFLDTVRSLLRGIGTGDGSSVRTPRIGLNDYLHIKCYLPDLEIQRRIADRLDRETGEIDSLVKELDEYVGLLEKRKDLYIEAKLSERGPKLCAVGFVGDVMLGKMVNSNPSSSADELRPYLRAAHVQPNGFMDFSVPEKLMWFSPSEAERLNLRSGDVVVVEGGAGYGRSSFISDDLDGWGFQNSINRIRLNPERARGEFVSLMVNRALKRGEIELASNVATIPHFTAEKLSRFRIPIISLDSQKEFLRDVLDEVARTNSIITECTSLKELLLKRRQVLITDMVTGKVEV